MMSPAAAAERAAASRPMRRARGLWAGVSLLIVVLVAGLPSAFAQRAALRRPDSNASGRAKPMPLVNIDDTLGGYLNTARDCIEANEPLRAIEILQRLINLTETTLIADGDGRRYVSMAYKAADLIGSLGEEGLALYRSMYDPQAQRLFEEALSAGDTAALRKIAYRYLHSAYGARALDGMGSMAFDAGRFAQASRYWKQASLIHSPEVSEALLLAKMGAAQHLAGEAARLEETLAVLKEKFPQASARIGGKDQVLVDFLETVRKLPVSPQLVRGPRGEGWPGLGAFPDGLGIMSDVDVVLSPRWYDPPQASRSQPRLVAMADVGKGNPQNGGMRLSVTLKEGHVEGKFTGNQGYYPDGSNPNRPQTLPPIIHPVVVGDVVIYRTDGNLVALDLITGETRWSAIGLPMERNIKLPDYMRGYYYNQFGFQFEDTGRYTLTVANGLVFTVGNFRPQMPPNYGNPFMGGGTKPSSDDWIDSSELIAISITGQGKQAWRVGNKNGRDEGEKNAVVRLGRYLSAPTYDAGRLYVLVVHVENYHLVCLDAATGEKIWSTLVSQVPAISSDYGQPPVTYKAFPPAVADGRVYVATNAGVVAALDADTGQTVWAYQYDSPLNQVMGNRMGGYGYRPGKNYPPNPILLVGGKVICLPGDSEKVLALAPEDGALLWETDRGSQQNLSAVDGGRTVLSGPGLTVLSLADGSKLWGELPASESIMGRPAVTQTAVYASGRGKLLKLNLADYKIESRPLTGIEDNLALLGNLVSVKEELIAANTMGICAYMNYDQAWAKLTDRIAAAEPKVRCELLLTRGRFAFSAKRFPEALSDLSAARELATELNLSDVQSRGRPWLHRTYVSLANVAQDANASLAMYQKAAELAETSQEKGHMKLRLAKFHRARGTADAAEADRCQKAGDAAGAAQWSKLKVEELSQAIELAQQLAEEQGEEELADVQVGKDADDSILLDGRADFIVGRKLAHDVIQSIVRPYGRESYAALDAKAKAAMDEAKQKEDEQAMAQVGRRWPDSTWADPATVMAAEFLYRKALVSAQDSNAEPRAKADAMTDQALRLLAPLAAESSDRTVRIVANLGMAALYARGGRPGSAGYSAQRARELAADSAGGEPTIAFADFHGKLEEVLKQIGNDKLPSGGKQVQYISNLVMPLTAGLTFKDEQWYILRDQHDRPVRMGERVLMLQGNRAVFVSTVASDANVAVDWQALTGVDPAVLARYGQQPTCTKVVAGLSRDEKVVAVCDRSSVRGFDVRTAKAVWSKTMAEMGMPSGGLSVYDGGALGGKPLWTCNKYNQNQQPLLLAVSNDFVAVAPTMNGQVVEVRPMTGGEPLVMSATLPEVGGMRAVPIDATIEGANLLVLSAANPVGQRGNLGQQYYLQTLGLHRINLEKKVRAWSYEVEGMGPGANVTLTKPVIGTNYVAMLARNLQGGEPAVHVIDMQTGKRAGKIDLMGKVQNFERQQQLRLWMMGPPVMTNGKLCVETMEGMVIYGGQ